MARKTYKPSGRAGPLDGLPSGNRVAATWLPDPDPDADFCYHQNRHCRGRLVTVHDIDDYPNGGPTASHSTTTTCVAHAVARHGVHPSGQPTAHYQAAVSSGQRVDCWIEETAPADAAQAICQDEGLGHECYGAVKSVNGMLPRCADHRAHYM